MKARTVAVETAGQAFGAVWAMVVASTVVFLAVALCAADAGAGEPGEAIQLCTCLGTLEQADAMAAEYRRLVPGLVTEVRPKSVGKRTVYEIWARHPTKPPQDICGDIGRAGCEGNRQAVQGCE